jgi:hypothetical protein
VARPRGEAPSRLGPSARLRSAAAEQPDLQQRSQHRRRQQRDEYRDDYQSERPDPDHAACGSDGACGAARRRLAASGIAANENPASGVGSGSARPYGLARTGAAALGRAEGRHAAKSICTRRRQARDTRSGGAAQEAPAGSARPAALAVTERHAGNRAVGGACSNSKTGHTAIAWTCRHTGSTSNCAKRAQAGHTGNIAACRCETCDTAGATPSCEVGTAARAKAGCAPDSTAACRCETCDTAGATPSCEVGSAARAKAGCAPDSTAACRCAPGTTSASAQDCSAAAKGMPAGQEHGRREWAAGL